MRVRALFAIARGNSKRGKCSKVWPHTPITAPLRRSTSSDHRQSFTSFCTEYRQHETRTKYHRWLPPIRFIPPPKGCFHTEVCPPSGIGVHCTLYSVQCTRCSQCPLSMYPCPIRLKFCSFTLNSDIDKFSLIIHHIREKILIFNFSVDLHVKVCEKNFLNVFVAESNLLYAWGKDRKNSSAFSSWKVE